MLHLYSMGDPAAPAAKKWNKLTTSALPHRLIKFYSFTKAQKETSEPL